ncbi:TRAP transporter substrate-binding protein [Calderihabitans maritimus]|uniref:TRAP dicarboxylate transporter subunit DctP n=1 Tax=Calderihabitans maritimus TaxID=1246530 RepID=A0A1Z5HW68_9FIRM|nr:TRAP transporter substrate-binding protein [Calderihabitans maritimus]GAW93782.1 TRAP dicarboxylate transporter subunit DctP [Calderihabitans maritimus]
MYRSQSIIAFAVIVVLTAFLIVGCSGGNSQPTGQETGGNGDSTKTINLKVGHVLAPTHPYQLGLEKFAELVAEKSGGRVKVEVFHSSQLGNEREMIEGLQMGTLDMTLVSTAPLAGFSNKFLVFDLPFIFQSREQAYKVLDGPIGTEILDSLKDQGIVGLAYWENGFRNVTNSKRPVIHPEDMKGMKIRTMENKIHMASFKTIGADPTPMAFGELFTALQQQTVDAQENPIPIIYTSNFFEVQKYLSLTGHFYAAAPLLISKARWDTLPADVQQAIKEAAIEARDYERELIQKMDNELLEELKKKGMEVSEVDKNEWLKAMEPVYKQFEDEIGADVIAKVRGVK